MEFVAACGAKLESIEVRFFTNNTIPTVDIEHDTRRSNFFTKQKSLLLLTAEILICGRQKQKAEPIIGPAFNIA